MLVETLFSPAGDKAFGTSMECSALSTSSLKWFSIFRTVKICSPWFNTPSSSPTVTNSVKSWMNPASLTTRYTNPFLCSEKRDSSASPAEQSLSILAVKSNSSGFPYFTSSKKLPPRTRVKVNRGSISPILLMIRTTKVTTATSAVFRSLGSTRFTWSSLSNTSRS